MDRVATDIVGPFPVTENGNRYIVVIGDYFTKWIEAYAIPDFSAGMVAKKVVFEFSPGSEFRWIYIRIKDVITNRNSSANCVVCWRSTRLDHRRTTRLLME